MLLFPLRVNATHFNIFSQWSLRTTTLADRLEALQFVERFVELA